MIMIRTCLVFLWIFYFTAAMYTKNNEIFDLQETTSSGFVQEAIEWQLTGLQGSAKTSICSGTYLVAGFKILTPYSTMQRTYTISQSHTSVFISFELYMMGKWEVTDQVTIQVKSGSTVVGSSNLFTRPSGSIPFSFEYGGLCTSDSTSIYSAQTLYLSSPHTGSELTLFFQFSAPGSTTPLGTFGIRNVRILVSNTVLSSVTQCTSITDLTNSCDCDPGQRKSGGSCIACDSSCDTCSSSGSCYSCASNYYYTGTACLKCATGCATCSAGAATNCLTCQSSSSFMYPDGSCKASCSSPYTSATVAGIKYCYFPCGQTGDYYFPDTNCRSPCELPFKDVPDANGAKFCNSPCSSGFYYSDGSCQPTCSSPFKPVITYGAKFCNNPCNAGEYYYPDTVCRSFCDLPFTTTLTYGAKFCNYPCGMTGNYYYSRDNICRSACASPYKPSTDATGAKFCDYPCDTIGDYYFPDGICRSICDFPFTQETDSNGAKFCKYPCGQTGEFYYNNTVCRPACDSPYKPITDETGAKFCIDPCDPGERYFPDGNCRSHCDSPFKPITDVYGASFCDYPCDNDNYYYGDRNCRSACDLPYKPITDETGAKFCNYPCDDSVDYYFPDKNCRSFCNLPFKPVTDDYGGHFCEYPCEDNNYYFPDDICLPTCDTPYRPITDDTGANFCNYPCEDHDNNYYYRDNACRLSCDSPFTPTTDTHGAQFCNYPCHPDEYRYIDGACSSSQCPGYFEVKNYHDSLEYKYCECVSPNVLTGDGSCSPKAIENLGSVGNTTGIINSVGLAVAAIAFPGDPGGVSTGALTRIIQYSKFLNVSYPEKLVLMFKAYNPASGIVSFVPKMTDEQKNKFRYEPLPYNFVAYGVHSCFVVNFWNYMIFLLILFGVCAGCLIIEKLSKEAGVWARKVRAILQNFWIVQLYNSSGDIMLFSIIQFKNNSWNSSEDTLSFLMAILFMLMLTIVLVFHFRTSMEYQKFKKGSSEIKKFEKNYECQQIFFESFLDRTTNHQLFLFYFALRIMLHNLIIATLGELPILQTILMMSLSLLLVIYIIAKRPFKSKIDLAQNLTYEFIILTVNIALLSFAALDEEKIGARNNLAELIIVCSVMFTFLSLFFILLKVIILGIQFYKEYKQKKATSKGSTKLDLEKTETLSQGLQIIQTRKLSNLGTRNTVESSDIQQLDLNNRKLSSDVPLDLSTSLFPLNNNNNNSVLHYQNSNFDSTLDLSLPEGQNHTIHAFQQEQISHPGFKGRKKRMLNNRDVDHEEISIEPNNDETTEENIVIRNKHGFQGLKRRMLNDRNGNADGDHEEIEVQLENDEPIGENILAGNKRGLKGIKRRMLNNRDG